MLSPCIWLARLPARRVRWAAIPDVVSDSPVPQLRTQCLRSLGDVPKQAAPVPSRLGAAERRGDTTSVLVASSGSIGVCIGLKHSREDGLTAPGPFPAGTVLVLDGAPGQLNGPEATRVVFGRTRSEVRSVTVETADGRQVTASIRSGYYLACWPSVAIRRGPDEYHRTRTKPRDPVRVEPKSEAQDRRSQLMAGYYSCTRSLRFGLHLGCSRCACSHCGNRLGRMRPCRLCRQ